MSAMTSRCRSVMAVRCRSVTSSIMARSYSLDRGTTIPRGVYPVVYCLRSGHRDLAEHPRRDPVEDLRQAVAGARDAVVPETDHGVRRIGLGRDQVGDCHSELLR